MRSRLHRLLALGAFTALAGLMRAATPAPPVGISGPIEWAEIEPLAPKSLLLALAAAGTRLVSVGERGHVVLSDDEGRTWRQAAQVPTRVLLTGVCFADEQHGIAVGHDETIVVTSDGGARWTLAHQAPEALKPLLDVWCGPGGRAIAVGAYMDYLTSDDYGSTWRPRKFEPAALARAAGEPLDYHLNRIAALGTRFYIAAEGGHLYRSDDDAASWIELPSPYTGSFFGVLPLTREAVLAFGLRGHLYRSDDAGLHWREAPSGTLALLSGAASYPGGLVVVGLSGAVLVSRDGGSSLTLHQQDDRRGLSAVMAGTAGQLVVAGEGGARVIAVAAP